MIIGISGKIGSGKDTIARIMQYWLFCKTNYAGAVGSIEDCAKYLDDLEKGRIIADNVVVHISGWEIKKYAGKLKQVVSMFTGYTAEQLELPQIKDTLLEDEWQVFELYTFGKPVTSGHYNKIITSFLTEDEVREFCDDRSSSQHQFTYKKTQRTVRWLLQAMGTEAMREKVHPNIWVNALYADYIAKQGIGLEHHTWDNPELPNWIITDVRFQNEANAVLRRKGILIRVNRPCEECGVIEGHKMIPHKVPPSVHESETALDEFQNFTHTIDNDGDLEDLITKVQRILSKENLI